MNNFLDCFVDVGVVSYVYVDEFNVRDGVGGFWIVGGVEDMSVV